ncbi:DUF1566 domain-containing protein [Stutzerimonas stutzeri]|uniref:DUF1566 domain-containing protein n=1 Tax=Stutzerimonas stutzeri TaxID=316 RepID=UPI00244A67E9|nr:DUF1566 domain-containing protein [Stutzerimonas stutzeri]MDH0100084.1 DUF1566 domain-containing protein [Stutzerimonas stutzeri]
MSRLIELTAGNTKITTDNPELIRGALEIAISSATRDCPTTPSPGQMWPEQGGIYAGVMHDNGERWHLIVPVGHEDPELEWGGYGKKSNASSLRDGASNTRALLAESDHPAAEYATAFKQGDFDDFYLPSKAELALAWINAPESFKGDEWYWSSTEYAPNTNSAWIQRFSDGGQDSGNKTYAYLVRPVRRLKI